MSENSKKTVIIVGGGLVGALNACFLAKRGYLVEMYEMRADIRKEEFVRGRSINLALSCRGREALKAVGLEEHIVSNGIPMYARMIHDLDGTRRPIPYGTKDQYIMSVDRRKLNELMLTAAENYPGVNIHFEHKMHKCNFDKNMVTFERNDGSHVEVTGDIIVGADGAYSKVREQLMKQTRFDFSQEYIPHGYIELSIPASKDNQFNMEVNYLHIWPRNEYMMIALPNTEDNSFVVTLFMPFDMFDKIKDKTALLEFFQDKFPDAIPLIGRENLVDSFLSSKALPLVSIKCSPYHLGDNVLLLGDAAHAMVPFYGQGMNCGFEDCLVLNGLLDTYKDDWGETLKEYTKFRNPDCKAICDLAKYNYVEMRSSVNSKLFIMRKKLDNFLHWMFPEKWVPLYTMVSFTRTRYHQCIEKRKWQDKVLQKVMSGTAIVTLGLGAVLTLKLKAQGLGNDMLPTQWLPSGLAENFNHILSYK